MRKFVTIILLSVVAAVSAMAQEAVDTTKLSKDYTIEGDSLVLMMPAQKQKKQKRDWTTWKPNVKKAMWMAIVIPGGGQIYNRKYWKLPIVYGGFVGCIYAWRWNGQMYSDYSQAYLDISDDDPNTKSYEKFLHLGVEITEQNKSYYTDVFRKRKDMYRRWRDMSTFCTIGVYLLSIVDAYVDASLSQFDISNDLSMKVAPAYLNGRGDMMTATRENVASLSNGGLGVRCRLNF